MDDIDWVDDEFSLIDLKDKRVNGTSKRIIRTIASRPGVSLTEAFPTHSELEGCYRFLASGRVTAERILEPHLKSTLKRIKAESVILLPQDTTSLNYSSKLSVEGLGEISAKGNKGLFVHALLAITPSRVNLGLVKAQIWAREKRTEKLSRKEIYKLPMKEKEQVRWAEFYKTACLVTKECPDTQVIAIGDRENDFAEFFEFVGKFTKRKRYAHVIVRGAYDRALIMDKVKISKGLTDEEKNKLEEEHLIQKKLLSKLKNSETLGEITYQLAATESRKKRTVVQSIKTSTITFKKRVAGSPAVTMNVVMAIEESPPEGEEPLVWWFLTTLPITTLEDAVKVIEYYLARWEIEVFFKILKSGCKVEERGLGIDGLVPLIAIFLAVSWRIAYTVKLGRICPDISAEILFKESEWKAVYKVLNKNCPLPEKAPSLGVFIIWIARLGGYLNRKNDPPPGVTVMWRGFNKMQILTEAWESWGMGEIEIVKRQYLLTDSFENATPS